MPMNMLDIGKAYGDAERIKGMRTQNAMADYTLEAAKEDRISEKDEGNRQWTAKSLDWLLAQPEQEHARLYEGLRQEAIGRGMDEARIPPTFDREFAERTVAVAKGFGGPAKPQSKLGKSEADRRAGFITDDEHEALGKKATALPQGGQSMYKIQDKDSPTGWSYADRQGNPSIKGAPPPSGGQEITVGPDGSVRVGPMTGAQAGKLTQDSINREDKSTENIGEIEASLDDLARVDYSTGIPGYAIDELGGLLAQLPLVGNDLAKKLGTEEVANVRSSLQGLVARMVSTYTGEESGRITKEELAISQAASKAKDPKADMTQIVGALNSIREIEMRVVARERMKQANIPDLTSSVGRQKYVDSLRKQHPDETDEALVDRLVEAMRTYKIFNNYKKYDPR